MTEIDLAFENAIQETFGNVTSVCVCGCASVLLLLYLSMAMTFIRLQHSLVVYPHLIQLHQFRLI